MLVSSRAQLYVGLGLAALLWLTRGQHFGGLDLPSASWAAFFLAGVLLKPRWVFAALFSLASLVDFVAIGWLGVSDWCLSPAYWALVPAYGSLFFGGRLYARLHRDSLSGIATLSAVAVLSAFVCYVISGGSFLYFSGRFAEPTLAMLGEHIATYYPAYLASMSFYVGVAAVLYAGLQVWQTGLQEEVRA